MRLDNDLVDHSEEYIKTLENSYITLRKSFRWSLITSSIAIICLIICIITQVCIDNRQHTIMASLELDEEISHLSHQDSIILMASAFAMQETKCHNVDSPDGKYCGYLQMSEIIVREANRLVGKDIYTYDDRYDWDKCVEMFSIIMDNKNPSLDVDIAIDIWNEKCPKLYRNQVKTYYNFLLNKTFNEAN